MRLGTAIDMPRLVVLMFAATAIVAAGAQQPATYSVDWSAVPASSASSSPSSSPPRELRTGCACALLNGTCAPGCCCDARCPRALVAAFEASPEGCLPSGEPEPQLDYCAPVGGFARVNLPSGAFARVSTRTAPDDLLSQLLCVAGDNNPSLGSAWPDPAAGDVGGNARAAACGAQPPPPPPAAGAYSYGDAVIARAPVPGGGGAVAQGRFLLPGPGAATSECALGMAEVGFLERRPARPSNAAMMCLRPLPAGAAAFRALCEDPASPLSPLLWARTQFATSPVAAAFVNATVVSWSAVDPATGAPGTPLTGVAAAAAAAAPTYVPAAAGRPAACHGVVLRADLALTAALGEGDGAGGAVAAAAVALVVGDVEQGAAPLAQAASTTWVVAGDGSSSSSGGSSSQAPPLALSGAPGYQLGAPVVAGLRLASPAGDKTAVARLVGGLVLPGPSSGGSGSSGGGSSSCTAGGPPLRYGYNTDAACAVELTAGELEALCAAAGTGDRAAALLPAARALLAAAVDGAARVGVWGDADGASAADWVPLAAAGWPPAAPLWSPGDARCDGLVVGYELKLVTGVAFAAASPQRKVVYAQLCPTLGSWSARARGSGGGNGGGAVRKRHWARFAARFVPLDQGAPAAALRPAPPLVAPLPPDLFYPFV